MGLLPSLDVYRMIEAGDLVIEPFEYRGDRTPPASIDLRLSSKVIRYSFPENEYLIGDEIDDDQGATELLQEDYYLLEPGQGVVFVLYEKLVLPPSLAGIIVPRSSLTRLGVALQSTYLNPGYQGNCPVLLANQTDFRVKIPFRNGIGPRMAQVLFLSLASLPHRHYGVGADEKYQNDLGFPSKFNEDIDIVELIAPFKRILDRI